jgi:hypothetical protein
MATTPWIHDTDSKVPPEGVAGYDDRIYRLNHLFGQGAVSPACCDKCRAGCRHLAVVRKMVWVADEFIDILLGSQCAWLDDCRRAGLPRLAPINCPAGHSNQPCTASRPAGR